jgi:hypothetical protein
VRAALVGLALAAALAAIPAATASPGVRVLLTAKVEIGRVVQDGPRIAWQTGPCLRVWSRDPRTGRNALLGRRATEICSAGFAVAGPRALWTDEASGNFVYTDVYSRERGGRRPAYHEEVVGSSAGGDGDYFVGAAGDASLLVYATIALTYRECTPAGPPCEFLVRRARLKRIVRDRALIVPGIPPMGALAVGAGRMALVTIASRSPKSEFAQTGVEVREGVSGRIVARIQPSGRVEELALSRFALALLVRAGGRLRLERYALPDGKLLGATAVYGHASELSISGDRIVLRTGRVIRLVDAVTGRSRILATGRRPFSVSIEGRRVVWVDGRRILALSV